MNVARRLAAATVLNGSIYIAGGINETTFIKSVELYDSKTDEWVRVASMNMPRWFFGLIASNRFLFAMGDHKEIEKFDPHKNCWTKVCESDGKQ